MSDHRPAVESNEQTGDYWTCPECWWEGPEATIDTESWFVRCPECNTVMDDELHRRANNDL